MKALTTLALISSLSFATIARSQEVNLPVIKAPSILNEGTQRELSASQIAELLPWAKDSKMFLVDLLDNIKSLSTTDKIDRLVEGMKQVVGDSSKNSQLFMRFALNRGIVLNNLILEEADVNAVGTSDAQFRVLRASVYMAIKYYDTDLQVLTKKSAAPYVMFGLDYFEFLSELNKSIFDASAQYKIQRTSFEWLQWDLYRDVNNTSFAPHITKVNNSLRSFPEKALSDGKAIGYIRQMKNISIQLRSSEDISKIILRLKKEKQNIFQDNYIKGKSNRSKEFETLMAKKILISTIGEGIAISKELMKHVVNTKDFFDAISPGISNFNSTYNDQLKVLAMENYSVLMGVEDVTAKDILELARIIDHVPFIAMITNEFIPLVTSADEFLILVSYWTSSPSEAYKVALKKLAMSNMSYFMSLSPTEEQKKELLKRFQ